MNTIILKGAKFVENTFADGSRQLVGTVQGDSFVGTDIPTEPNPRQFVGDANPNYKDMIKTLRNEPEMFARKNSAGITLFATAVDNMGDGSYKVTFSDGDGIANGGHTYNALRVAGRDSSQVKVTIEIGLDMDKVVEIATALNLNKKLQSYSLHNKEGAYDWHKKALADKTDDIIYHEGDTGSVEVKEAMAFLNLFSYDADTDEIDMMENIQQSEQGATALLNRIADDTDNFAGSLRWIAKDVHAVMMDTIFDEDMIIKLAPYKRAYGQNWIKTRAGRKGIVKGLGLLLVAGLAQVGTELNQNGIVRWADGYKTAQERKAFIKALFDKVSVTLEVQDGTPSQIVRVDKFRQDVLKFAKSINSRRA